MCRHEDERRKGRRVFTAEAQRTQSFAEEWCVLKFPIVPLRCLSACHPKRSRGTRARRAARKCRLERSLFESHEMNVIRSRKPSLATCLRRRDGPPGPLKRLHREGSKTQRMRKGSALAPRLQARADHSCLSAIFASSRLCGEILVRAARKSSRACARDFMPRAAPHPNPLPGGERGPTFGYTDVSHPM